MIPIFICLLSLVISGISGLLCAGWNERGRRKEAEREFGFWDANVLAAIRGGAIQ